MPIIKNVKRNFFSEELEQWGFEFTCKVNMDSKTGAMFMEIPDHIADTFITHNINTNEEFKNYFNFKMNKAKAVVYFIDKDISSFDKKIDLINHFYNELKANKLDVF